MPGFGMKIPIYYGIYSFTVSAVITRSNILRYFTNNYRNWDRISIRCWIHKRHPIPRPNERAMECLFVNICEKIEPCYNGKNTPPMPLIPNIINDTNIIPCCRICSPPNKEIVPFQASFALGHICIQRASPLWLKSYAYGNLWAIHKAMYLPIHLIY